jgi:hypothetical protein
MNADFNGNPRHAAVCEQQFWHSMEDLLPIFEREGIPSNPLGLPGAPPPTTRTQKDCEAP